MIDVNEKKWDKINGDVAFYEEEHKYINIKNPFIKYTSVTTLIGEFYEKFDADFMSKYKALEALSDREEFTKLKQLTKMTTTKVWKPEYLETLNVDAEVHELKTQEFLNEWSETNREACELGTIIHLERENEFYDPQNLQKLVKRHLNDDDYTRFSCVKHDFSLSRESAIIPEYLVYYSCPEEILHIAGQVDLLIKDGNKIKIHDFKTNKDGIKTKAFYSKRTGTKKMFYPLNNLDDTTLNHYTLQLSIYAFLLQKINPEFIIEELKLIHIDRQGNETEFIVPYLKNEVIRMLNFKKKKLKAEKFNKEYDI